ncbi:hypothetical protein LTR66_014210, partial [Elasticomyces elasticus]
MTSHEVPRRHTQVFAVDPSRIGKITATGSPDFPLDDWDVHLDDHVQDVQHLRTAALQLRESDVPVAFPTETVYGLGANATRSSAVKGIYAAKQRPSDNPLIVHVASLRQLRGLLEARDHGVEARTAGMCEEASKNSLSDDIIPAIYKPLIDRFWPGPLTIILPTSPHSQLAPEVTAGLSTFGARMPRNLIALVLIKLAGVPIAAPSANASTRPSPTAAEHVQNDLDGRIDTIIDGGPCDVGVESTVVDGLSDPPTVLRPGGISLEQLRKCPGWEHTEIAYNDASEEGATPKAPGMKYRHYSPRATVILYENGSRMPGIPDLHRRLGQFRR